MNCKVMLMIFAATVAAAAAGTLKKGDAFPRIQGIQAGQVTLVDFWASWCSPCKASFPAMDRLQEKYGKRGFAVVAVSVDEDEDAMRQFLADHPVTFKVLHDTDHGLVSQVDIPAMPTSFLLDTAGHVAVVHEGFRGEETEKELDAEVSKLLEESHR